MNVHAWLYVSRDPVNGLVRLHVSRPAVVGVTWSGAPWVDEPTDAAREVAK